MFHCIFLLWVLIVRAEEPLMVNDSTTTITSSIITTLPSDQTTTTVLTPTTKEPSSPTSSRTTRSTVQVIGELNGLAHGVRSGQIISVGSKIIEVPNFYFDGTAPTAFFIAGSGDKVTGNGTFIYLDPSTKAPLTQYNGESIKLTLPDNLTIDNVDWLAVWCVKFEQNLGYVFLHKPKSPYPPQTFNLQGEVTSGFVVLVDKKTLFVPNFRYDGSHKNVRFWVGNGTRPTYEGVPIPDETGSTVNLRAYQGENLNLKLPRDLTTDNIDYFGVWSLDEDRDLGHVPIRGIKGVPEAKVQKKKGLVSGVSDSFSMRLPKCCGTTSVLTPTGCEERGSIQPFKPQFKVFKHNLTHFWNESLDVSVIDFVPYTSTPLCDGGKYALNEKIEEFAILENSSLLLKGPLVAGILSTDRFCLENVVDDNGTSEMSILVCAPEQKIQSAMFFTYVAFTIISTLCFAATFVLYFFWLKIEDIHRKCFTGYVFTMCITFLILTIVQTADVEEGACEALGFFFQIFMIASFTLLGILCFDIWIIIKYINEDMLRTKRKWSYLAVALGVPILSLIVSLSRNLTPDVPNSFFKPQYLKNTCYFEAENQRTVYFYVPIAISIVVSIVFLILTKLKIVDHDRNAKNHFFWIEKGVIYKFMWRKHLIIFITSLMWCLETIIHLNFANSNMLIAIDIVEASQGILVVFLFVLNKETRMQVLRQIKARRRRKIPIITEEQLMMT